MLKLASIEKIKKLSPIVGADSIEVADILGYKVVVRKGQFQEGDFCIYIQSDTVAPDRPEYEMLKNKSFRVKIIRLKGQYSEGLALPISILDGRAALDEGKELGNSWSIKTPTSVYRSFGNIGEEAVSEGWDITAEMGVTKYSKPVPACLAGDAEGYFPSFLKKTDELNIRTYPETVEEMKGKESILTLKMDGSSGTFYLKDEKFGVCSRNLELKESSLNAFWKVAKEYKIEEALRAFRVKYPGDYACQGEVYGPGIQGNPMKADKIKLSLFNFFSIKLQKYADFDIFMEFCLENNLPFAPVVWAGKFDFTLEQLIEMANKSEYLPGVNAEGLVCRPCKDQESNTLGGRMSFKIISEPYSLKND